MHTTMDDDDVLFMLVRNQHLFFATCARYHYNYWIAHCSLYSCSQTIQAETVKNKHCILQRGFNSLYSFLGLKLFRICICKLWYYTDMITLLLYRMINFICILVELVLHFQWISITIRDKNYIIFLSLAFWSPFYCKRIASFATTHGFFSFVYHQNKWGHD